MKLFLIGNSFSYYWTDELYKLLAASGDEDAVVCNIYYSGCTFDMHLNWWKNGDDPYTVLIHDKNGRTVIKNATFEMGLSYANWDKISFQQSGRYIYRSGAEMHDEMIRDYLPELYERVHARFPDAEYYWLQNWTHELGNAGHGMKSPERQDEIYRGFRDVGLKYCEQFGFTNVPCGDAWRSIRHDPMFYAPAKDDVSYPFRTLHTRISTASFKNYPFIHNEDLSHDGDIGGGQYLNAAVWFEMLTHKSVIGNTYIPTYTHETAGITFTFTEERVAALQNAAHRAVLEAYGKEWYND